MRALQDYIDAQFGGPGRASSGSSDRPRRGRSSTRQARRRPRGRGLRGARLRPDERRRRTARPSRSTRELDELYVVGVRSLFPVHNFDNALGGDALRRRRHRPPGQHRHKYVTGQFWDAEPCADPVHDNTPTNLIGNNDATPSVFGPVLTPPAVPGPTSGSIRRRRTPIRVD